MLRKSVVTLVVIGVMAMTSIPASTANLGSTVLKGAAVGYLVKQSAKSLNQFINNITFQHHVPSNLSTKVVPIVSLGIKAYVGGAQVSGPKALVNKVQAVFQVEKNFSSGNYRVKGLVPSSSLNPLKLSRVPKVGVSAIIDVSVEGGLTKSQASGKIGVNQLIRAAAVAVAINAVAKPLNSFINTITFNKNGVTKVVPMASIGDHAYIGGAQITGSTTTMGKVKAVWQFEGIFANGKFRIKALVPANSTNPLKLKRVSGVGVLAIIDTTMAKQGEAPRIHRYMPPGKSKSSITINTHGSNRNSSKLRIKVKHKEHKD